MSLICSYCNKPITGEYIILGDKKYHTSCFKDHIELKCGICHQGINGNYLHDEWGNNVCAHHNARYCDSCSKIITTNNTRPVNGRYYCQSCTAISVNSSVHTASVYQNILKTYNRYGIQQVPANVPVHIVDAKALAAKSSSLSTPDLLGLAVTGSKWSNFSPVKTFTHDIYILGGLPVPEFESVLAHELLHTWLNQYEVKMNEAEIEGFCNLGSYLVLTIAATKHAQMLMKKIKEDPGEIYGAGFRKMLAEVKQKGWLKFLTDVKARK